YDIAHRLGHFLTAVEYEAVAEHALWQLNAGRQEEGRPVDRMEAHYVLAYDVGICRPVAPAFRLVIRIAGACEIVRQRVDPDIHHVPFVAGNGNAPVEGRAGNGQILQAGPDEAHHLVATFGRSDEFRTCLIQVEQFVLIGRKPEEVAFLL